MSPTLPSFDELQALARHQPEALAALRDELVEAVITQAPLARQSRLRGLQFHIEQRCRLAATPLAACIWLSQQMHHSLSQLQQAFDPCISAGTTLPPRCPVVPFRSLPRAVNTIR